METEIEIERERDRDRDRARDRDIDIDIDIDAPPMIHARARIVGSGSWEVGNLRCKNIDRDQISPKFLKPEMRKH